MGEVLAGEVDEQGPWNIRAISSRLRKAISLAAQAEGITVGQWLERELRWVVDGAPNQRVSNTSTAVKQPGNQLVPVRQASVSNAMDTAEGLVRAALALAGATKEQQADPLVRTARSTVRRRLLAARE